MDSPEFSWAEFFVRVTPMAGSRIDLVLREALLLANFLKKTVPIVFNKTRLDVAPGARVEDLLRVYWGSRGEAQP